MKTTYIQGETIDAEVSAPEAVAVSMIVYTEADAAQAADAALKAAAANAKQSITVGEISMSDKSAEELLTLRAAVSASSEFHRFTLARSAEGLWTCHAPTANLCGAYSFAILTDAPNGSVVSHSSGKFSVVGSPSKAASRGGFKTILSSF